jgi:hypothetical protein
MQPSLTARAPLVWLVWLGFAGALVACGGVPKPASAFPDAKSAVGRLDATYAGVSGVRGAAKIDYLGDKGRVHGELSLLGSAPSSMRFAIKADVIGAAGEVTTDGVEFMADDRAHGRYLFGPAKPCNIAKITQVPLPSDELLPLLWGMRPPIAGPIVRDSIRWSEEGWYVVMLAPAPASNAIAHELHLQPLPEDQAKPWSEQRVRLLGVTGWRLAAGSLDGSEGTIVYRASLKDHAPTVTAGPLVDEDGLSPPVPPSGPSVRVEVPRTLRVEVPAKNSDVILKYSEVTLNPPLLPRVFQLMLRPEVPTGRVDCEE